MVLFVSIISEMKWVVSLILILLSGICTAQIPNSGFENWNIVGNDTTIANWRGDKTTVLNKIFVYSQQGTISREAYEGQYFIKLNHTDTSGSAASLGYFEAKFPYRSRPKSFTFKGMYFPQIQGEGFALVITLTKSSGDTISNTLSRFGTITVTNWSDLSTNLTYPASAAGDPDSCYIRFQLLPTSNNTVSLNTMLLIDALQFNNYTVSVNEELSNFNTPKNVVVYPNPANINTTISFNLDVASLTHLSVRDVTGKEVLSSQKQLKAGEAKLNIDASNFKQGIYLYQIKSGNNIVHGKFSVIH